MKTDISTLKKRFNLLLESKLGSVKPILSEELPVYQDKSYQTNPQSKPNAVSPSNSVWAEVSRYFSKYPCLLKWALNPLNIGKISEPRLTGTGDATFNIGPVSLYSNGHVYLRGNHITYTWDCDWFEKNIDKYVVTSNTQSSAAYQGDTRQYTVDQNVVSFQKVLSILGYNPGKPDGKFGPMTKTALENFQNDNNIKFTGKMDKITAEAMITKTRETIPDKSSEVEQLLSKIAVVPKEQPNPQPKQPIGQTLKNPNDNSMITGYFDRGGNK